MGFRPEPKQYKLRFDPDTGLEGLEVVMGSLTVGEYNKMLREGLATGITTETLDANDWLLELFTDRLVSWNLEDAKGKTVPRTIEAVLEQERSMIGQILTAWQIAMVTVPKPSLTQSGNGESKLTPEDLAALASLSAPES